MNIKIREQAGIDAVRKFDYQMAVALDYLLSEMDDKEHPQLLREHDYIVYTEEINHMINL